VQRVGEPVVAGVAGEHDLLLPGRFGDRAGPGVVLARPSTGVAGGVVAELGEHPGGEHVAKPWLGAVALSVRVPTKMGHHLDFHRLDLGVEAVITAVSDRTIAAYAPVTTGG
jgi:hypothetical protein